MKFIKLFFLFLGISFLTNGYGQFTPKTTGISSFARFMKSETYFVFTENVEVDSALVKAVNENWNITPSHFISPDSFLVLSKDRDKSFVYISKLKQMGAGKQMEAVNLVNGGYDDMAKYLNNTLAYISIDNEGYEANLDEIVYRLGHIIYQLQDIVLITKEENFVEKSEAMVIKKMEKYYTKRCEPIQNKTLLVDKRYLSQKIISQSEFENLYKYDLMFVDKEAIDIAIKKKDESKVYLVSAVNLYKINTITDCATGAILYIEFEEENKMTNEFNRNFDRDDILLLNGHVKSGK